MTYKIPALSVVLNQFPEFTREDYPGFIKFIELYYKHLNENQISGIGENFDELQDIDTTLDKFIDALWKQFGINVPRTSIPNDRYFLKHIKEFYSTKGSEESFRMLFRHLYDTEIDFTYPKEQILIASDGKWVQDISVLVNVTSGNIFDVIDQTTLISTNSQIFPVVANRVRLLEDGHYEIFLDKFQRDLISIGSILSMNDVNATVVETVSDIKVYKPGIGFYVGQLFTIPSFNGTNARIKVTKVGPNGELIHVQLIDFGNGYNTDFYTTVVSGSTPQIVISGQYASQTLGFIDSGFVSSNFYAELDYANGSYSGDIIREFYTQIDVPEGTRLDDEKTATLYVSIGAIRRYPGFYSDSSGFLSDAYYIQDGHYYQTNSYVISCVESIEKYRSVVKALLHPSGLKLFGNQVFSNSFDVIGSLQLVNRYFQIAFSDTVESIDSNKYGLSKPILDLLNAYDSNVINMGKALSDLIVLDESETLYISKILEEALSLDDSIGSSLSKGISDYVSFLGILYWDSSYADPDYTDPNIEPVITHAGSTYSIALTN
jgi:hypothetical protein